MGNNCALCLVDILPLSYFCPKLGLGGVGPYPAPYFHRLAVQRVKQWSPWPLTSSRLPCKCGGVCLIWIGPVRGIDLEARREWSQESGKGMQYRTERYMLAVEEDASMSDGAEVESGERRTRLSALAQWTLDSGLPWVLSSELVTQHTALFSGETNG